MERALARVIFLLPVATCDQGPHRTYLKKGVNVRLLGLLLGETLVLVPGLPLVLASQVWCRQAEKFAKVNTLSDQLPSDACAHRLPTKHAGLLGVAISDSSLLVAARQRTRFPHQR